VKQIRDKTVAMPIYAKQAKASDGRKNMRKIVMLAALALALAAGTAAIVIVDTQQAMACKVRYCP
jgi:hypothetical protein